MPGLTEEERINYILKLEMVKTIIEVRKKKNITQQELSELSGVDVTSISKIEEFMREPEIPTLVKLLRPLGYNIKAVPIDNQK